MRQCNASQLPVNRTSLKTLIPKEKSPLIVDQDLKRKVDKSLPILQTIYDKIRKKEQLYQAIIADSKQRYDTVATLAKEYQDLSNQGVRIINNSLILQQEPVKEDKQFILVRNYQSAANLKTSCTFSSIIKQYRSSKAELPHDIVTSHSIYERYRSKLAQGKENNQHQQKENTLQKVRKLSKEIDFDLEELRIRKNSSQSKLGQAKPLKLFRAEEKPKARKDKKTYFLQLQKRKLKLL